MKLYIWGGAGEHGRSCYFLKIGRFRLLFDCGVKKGNGEHYPLLDEEEILKIDAVFLTHSHEDHSAAIPLLYHKGYRGKVYAMKSTVNQFYKYVETWTASQRELGETVPFATEDTINVQFELLPTVSGQLVLDDVEIYWGRSGHLLGAVWFLVSHLKETFFYSGDFSPDSKILAIDHPSEVLCQYGREGLDIDLAVIDGAYGNDSTQQEEYINRLFSICAEVQEQGGKLLLPLPAYGRGQELLCLLVDADLSIPIAVEQSIYSSLKEYAIHSEFLSDQGHELLEQAIGSKRISVIHDEDQRQALVRQLGSSILLTTDGMLLSPLSQWYWCQLSSDSNNCVVFTGHLAKGSLGEKLVSGDIQNAGIKAEHCLYKVHQGAAEVRKLLKELQPKHTVLCHASRSKTAELAAELSADFSGILSAGPGDCITLNE